MKICNLKIFNTQDELIRNIDFPPQGISFVLGDIEAPKDGTKTSNSIGKTLLLKFLDYIFGANEESKIVKKELKGYILVAIVDHNEKRYEVKRELGQSSNISINGASYPLEKYKRFFDINRQTLARQIVLQSKQSIISVMPNPVEEDYQSVLTLLELYDICDSIQKIYRMQNDLKQNNFNKMQILHLLNISDEKVGDEIFFNEKDIENLSAKIDEINGYIAELKLNAENKSLQEEYTSQNRGVKSLRNELYELQSERDSLSQYISDSATTNLDSETIKMIYNKAKIELPENVIKSLDEVDAFYKAIYEDRIRQAKERIKQIDQSISAINKTILSIEERLDVIAGVLSTNDAYKNALEILYSYNLDLQKLKFKQGQLSQVSLYIKEDEAINNELLSEFSNLGVLKEKFDATHKLYKNFVYEIVNKIYTNARASFDIQFNKYDKKRRPINIAMEITGDAGEGVKEVKKTIMDYLLFYFNKSIDIFIHDSACYNGVDPRQISGLLKELSKMARENKKQVIVSINKYQLADDEFLQEVRDNACIILSENQKLLLCEF